MEHKNILNVIDELGALIEQYKDEIEIKDWEIKRLKTKIEDIEKFANSYSKE